MEHPLQPLERDLDALRAAWVGSMPAFGAIDGDAQFEVEQMHDPGLVRVTDLVARVRRDADALLARLSAEVAKRSGGEFGGQGLAKLHGFHNPVRLIAASTGASRHEAARFIAVGVATSRRQTFGGERLPARHPHVAAALQTAAISVDAASAITSMLDRVAGRADPRQADVAESVLVDLAARMPLERLVRGVREAEARLDHDGVEPDSRCPVRTSAPPDVRYPIGNTSPEARSHSTPTSGVPPEVVLRGALVHRLRRRRHISLVVGGSTKEGVAAGAGGTRECPAGLFPRRPAGHTIPPSRPPVVDSELSRRDRSNQPTDASSRAFTRRTSAAPHPVRGTRPAPIRGTTGQAGRADE